MVGISFISDVDEWTPVIQARPTFHINFVFISFFFTSNFMREWNQFEISNISPSVVLLIFGNVDENVRQMRYEVTALAGYILIFVAENLCNPVKKVLSEMIRKGQPHLMEVKISLSRVNLTWEPCNLMYNQPLPVADDPALNVVWKDQHFPKGERAVTWFEGWQCGGDNEGFSWMFIALLEWWVVNC